MKPYEFKYNIGDVVIVSNPMDNFGIEAAVIQQIKPLTYPEGDLKFEHLILMPRTRKEFRPTKHVSYLLKMSDEELYFWVTEICMKSRKVEPNGKAPVSKTGVL